MKRFCPRSRCSHLNVLTSPSLLMGGCYYIDIGINVNINIDIIDYIDINNKA